MSTLIMDYLYALQTLKSNLPEFVNYIFVFISEYLTKLLIVFVALIYWCIDKKAGKEILLSYSFAYSFNQTVKNIACVYRPWIKDARLHVDPLAEKTATGYSFPSGHTVMAASLYGGISVWKKNNKLIVVLMSFLILLTAFSRNWLGAHTLQDVVVAVCIAAVSLCVVNLFKLVIEKHPKIDFAVMSAGVVISIAILVFLNVKEYPIDYSPSGQILVDPYKMLTDCYTACGISCGTLIGWYLERHFVKFELEGVSVKEKIIRGAVGVVIFAFLYACLPFVLNFFGAHISHLIKYFIIFFMIMFGYPFCFEHCKKHKR